MSGKSSRNKGYRGEYRARKLLKATGLKPVWQAEDPSKPDIHSRKLERNIEVKYRKSVPKTIYKWLKEKAADLLMIKRVKRGESNPWLVVMEYNTFTSLLKEKEKHANKE